MPIEINTSNKFEYQFFRITGSCFTFKVRCGRDARIALTKAPHEGAPSYEVFIGGLENRRSAIRKDGQTPDVIKKSTPAFLSAREFRGFWIRWDDEVITVGREGEVDAFMSYEAGPLFQINFVGICTGWRTTGNWLLDDAAQWIPATSFFGLLDKY